MASTSNADSYHGYTTERLEELKTAFEICTTLDRSRFPLAATLFTKRDGRDASAANHNKNDTFNVHGDHHGDSNDRYAVLKSEIAALGLESATATSSAKTSAGDERATADLKAFTERATSVLKASHEEYRPLSEIKWRHRETEPHCLESNGQAKGESPQGSLRIKRPSKRRSILPATIVKKSSVEEATTNDARAQEVEGTTETPTTAELLPSAAIPALAKVFEKMLERNDSLSRMPSKTSIALDGMDGARSQLQGDAVVAQKGRLVAVC